jgi:hypothetical protein
MEKNKIKVENHFVGVNFHPNISQRAFALD